MRNFEIDYDYFYISKAFYKKYSKYFYDIVVMPIKDYLNNSTYNTVISASNHGIWNIKADFVLVAKEDWYEMLPADFQKTLFDETKANGSEFYYKDYPITIRFWKSLTADEKENIFDAFDDKPYDTDLSQFSAYDYFKKFHNVYPERHGANCFAATAYAVSKDEFFINQWIFQETLMLFLESRNYRATEAKTVEKDDVVCLFDEERMIHSFYCIDEEFCFNKNGQTMYEPWTIIRITDVLKEFNNTNFRIYRR